jgi:hypothetical protein
MEHIGKADDKNGFHEFRGLKADTKNTDPAPRPTRGHSDNEDKDNKKDPRSVKPFCLRRNDPVIIINNDADKDDTYDEGDKLFYDKVVRAAIKRACRADKVHDADGKEGKA